MGKINELQQALDELADVQLIDNTWQEAEVVRREITGIIQALHRDLCTASADLQEREGLRFQIDQCKKSRERLKARAEAAEAEANALRKRLGVAEANAAESRTLLVKDYSVMEKAGAILDVADEHLHDLREQLATVTALVPDLDWLRMVTCYPHGCAGCPYHKLVTGTLCDMQCGKISEVAGELAARIRAWRDGDGDGGGEKCCNDDYCRCGHHMEAHQYLVLADDDETVISSDACGVCDCQSFEQREEREGESDGD